jgi:hypothetical protein
VEDLVRADLATVPGSHAPAINAVVERFEAYFKSASALEAEAERMADDQIRTLGRQAAAGLDRHRVVQMIREKLAKDKGIPV